jgi:WXXGXW repeat (2 copies)
MKKYAFYLMAVFAVGALSSCAGSYVVRERPAEVVYSRPAAPSREYVWIGGDWVWTGGRYQWHDGRWDRPHAGNQWREGYWQDTRGGYKWHSGRWQRH